MNETGIDMHDTSRFMPVIDNAMTRLMRINRGPVIGFEPEAVKSRGWATITLEVQCPCNCPVEGRDQDEHDMALLQRMGREWLIERLRGGVEFDVEFEE